MASDGDIQFPPGQRREKPKFEPPPWERDQFEELAKQRVEPAPVTEPVEKPEDELSAAVTALVAESEGATAGTDPQLDEVPSGDEAVKPVLDPKHVEILLMGLRSEEPRPEEAYWKITTSIGVVSALIGLVLTTWGLVALATPKRPGAGPMFLVAVLLLFGLGFVAGGVWVVFRSLRQQGVL